MKSVHCPTCKKLVEPHEKPFPFCSERCRLIDLGNWLGGTYKIAGEAQPTNDSQLADSDLHDDTDR